jgi:hypothetical protein
MGDPGPGQGHAHFRCAGKSPPAGAAQLCPTRGLGATKEGAGFRTVKTGEALCLRAKRAGRRLNLELSYHSCG